MQEAVLVKIIDGKVADLYSCQRIKSENYKDQISLKINTEGKGFGIPNTGPLNTQLQYKSYADRANDFKSQYTNFVNCQESLDKIVGLINLDDSPYLLSYWAGKYPDLKPKYGDLYDKVWPNQWALFTELTSRRKGSSLKSMMVSLINPSPTQFGLKVKRAAIEKASRNTNDQILPSRMCESVLNSSNQCLDDSDFNRMFQNYYSSEGTLWISRLIADFAPYFTLRQTGTERLKTIAELEQEAKRPLIERNDATLEKQWLQIGATRTDIAVAQRSLLAGDVLIPLMYTFLDNPSEYLKPGEKPEIQSNLLDQVKVVLGLNPVLAKNLAAYALREQVLSERKETVNGQTKLLTENYLALRYHFAINASKDDDWLLKKVIRNSQAFSFKWEATTPQILTDTGSAAIEPSAEGWCFNLAGICVPVPSSADLQLGRFEQFPDLSPLLDARAELLDQLAMYDIYPTLDKRVRQSIAAAIVYQVRP